MKIKSETFIIIALVILVNAAIANEPNTEVANIPRFGDVLVATFDADRVILWNTNGDSLLRTNIDGMTESDLRCLLESKYVYDKLSAVPASQNDTDWGRNTAAKLHQIWITGTNLNDKIQMRLSILDAMRAYNGVKVPDSNAAERDRQNAALLQHAANTATASAIASSADLAAKDELAAQVMGAQLSVADTRREVRQIMDDGTKFHEEAAAQDQALQDSAARAQGAANAAALYAARSQRSSAERDANTANAYLFLANLDIYPTNQEYEVSLLREDLDMVRKKTAIH